MSAPTTVTAVDPFPTRDEFDTAVAEARSAATAYYETSTVESQLTDVEYDLLTDRIAATVDEHPDWDDQGTTTQVAAGTAPAGDVRHGIPMLSLDKVAGPARDTDLARWVGSLPARAQGVVVEPKIDGVAVRAVYQGGHRILVATRGDGTTGEDLTVRADALTITGLPTDLPVPVDVEVRGELFMAEDDFTESNNNRVAAGKAPFANPRNATSGSLRTETRRYDVALSFAAYDVLPAAGNTLDFDFHSLNMTQAATKLGVTTAASLIPGGGDRVEGAAAVEAAVHRIGDARTSLGFPIDGAVIKVDSLPGRDQLGAGSRAPKWAIAYKFPPLEVPSILTGVVPTIGRTGRLALTATFEPVPLDGSVVEKASVHNAPLAGAMGLAVGRKVIVRKANDIIPQITVAPGQEDDSRDEWVPPVTCPTCAGEWNKDTLLWRCENPDCSVAGRLEYAMKRDCLDVDGFGVAIAQALAESGQATTIADLYDLSVDDYAALVTGSDGSVLGVTNAQKIVAGLEASKGQPLNRVITALGIRMTGRSVGRWLASEFGTMDALRAATVDDLARIEKIGPVKAQAIVDGLAQVSEVIDRLAAHGLNMGTPVGDTDASALPLAGWNVVISGAVPGHTRTTAQEAVEAAGGKASSSVSKNTTVLVTGEAGTSKAKKAADLGVPILDPALFGELLAGEVHL